MTVKLEKLSEEEIYSFMLSNSRSFDPPLDQRVDVEQYSSKLAKHATHFIQKDETTGELMSLAACYFNDSEKKKSYLSFICVQKDYLGSGLGKTLLEEVISYGKRKGFRELELEVDNSNFRAIKMYSKMDFFEIDQVDNSLIMRKKL